MRDILCMYYSRTGATRQAMTEIAQALDAELVELTDGVDRSGARGLSPLRNGRHAPGPPCRWPPMKRSAPCPNTGW